MRPTASLLYIQTLLKTFEVTGKRVKVRSTVKKLDVLAPSIEMCTYVVTLVMSLSEAMFRSTTYVCSLLHNKFKVLFFYFFN